MSDEAKTVTIEVAEWRRLRRIEDAAAWSIGYLYGKASAESLAVVRRLEKATSKPTRRSQVNERGEMNQVHPLVVHLVLTYHWFDEMVNLRKHVEYRAMTPHWKRLIWNRRNEIAAARFSRGYTSETILRPLIGIDIGSCPYDGWDGDYYRLTLGLITEHNSVIKPTSYTKETTKPC